MAYIAKASNASGMSTLTRYVDMLAGNATYIENAYESIATISVGAGGASSATFSSIPQTYQHLQVRCYIKSAIATGSNGDSLYAYPLMGDSNATHYAAHNLLGDGATASTLSGTSSALLGLFVAPLSGATNTAGVAIIDILDYANTNKNKVIRTLGGFDTNNTTYGYVTFNSYLWINTTAISTFSIGMNANFAQYSHIALYGIRG